MATGDGDWGAFLQATFLTVLNASEEGIVAFDADGTCQMVGRRAGEIFGIDPAALVGKQRADVLKTFANACALPEVFLQAAAADAPLGAPRAAADVEVQRPRPRVVLCNGVPISRPGKGPGRLLFFRDVTRERNAERSARLMTEKLADVSPFDGLTGAFCARRFQEDLEREHGRSARAWDSFAVLAVDIDALEDLADELGGIIGDQVVQQVAMRLKSCLREYDALARLEGGTFGALLPGADALAARTVAERMSKAISTQEFTGAARHVTISVGGALWVPPSGEVGVDILRRARDAVVQARNHGIGGVHVDVPEKASA
jgi:diguanylate cyclase (GGDEF)-like protein/PAS domain S-box-containing protein